MLPKWPLTGGCLVEVNHRMLACRGLTSASRNPGFSSSIPTNHAHPCSRDSFIITPSELLDSSSRVWPLFSCSLDSTPAKVGSTNSKGLKYRGPLPTQLPQFLPLSGYHYFYVARYIVAQPTFKICSSKSL